ncbi:MAG: ATP-binding protein [Pseudobdellovibrionaceae bacterium]
MFTRFCKLSKTQSFFLFGPRGTGKSTLIQHHFKNDQVLWIDLLYQQTEFELANNPDRLIDLWHIKKPSWIVIDEVQKIPRILDVVHLGIEQYKIKFALTGSSARKLKRGSADLLAGRASSFELHALSAFELADQFDLHEALQYGLLPRLWNEELTLRDKINSLFSYVQTYLKEEIAAEQLVRNLDPFRRFLVSAAQSNSKILNFSIFEKDAGVSHQQAERHYEILEDTLIGHFLEPFDYSVRKQQTKKSKFYFFDTGVVRALTNLAAEDLHPQSFEYGDLFETFIYNEFLKLNAGLEKRWRFSYLKTKNDNEIDLVIQKPRGKPILIEIKSSRKIEDEVVSKFTKISKDIESSERYILYNGSISFETNKIRCLPWKQGLTEIFGL